MERSLVKTHYAHLKLTLEQKRVIEQRAARCKINVSAWMRSILLQAASKPSKNGYIRVREPDGASI